MGELKISSDLQNVIKKVVLDTYYPVGKTYITMGNEDPNKTIGGTSYIYPIYPFSIKKLARRFFRISLRNVKQ